MNVIYNSRQYWVVEYPVGLGYELVDKRMARGMYFQGDTAEKFAVSMKRVIAENASIEHVDKFLENFHGLMDPVIYH